MIEDVTTVEGQEQAARTTLAFVKAITDDREVEGDVCFQLFRFGTMIDGPIAEAEFSFQEGPESVVEELVDAAVHEAAETGTGHTRVKFRVKATRGGRLIPKSDTFTLSVPTRSEEDEEFLEESPSAKGVTAQLMRHQEKVMALGIKTAQKTIDTLQRENHDLREQNSQLMREHMQHWKLFQELVDGKHVRDMEIRRMEAEEGRKEKLAGMLMGNAPAIMHKLLGAESAPAKPGEATPIERMLEGFLATFTKDNLVSIAQTGKIDLDIAQRMALSEIVMAFVQRKEAENKTTQEHGQLNGAIPPS